MRSVQGLQIGERNVQHNTFYGTSEPVHWPVSIGFPPGRADALQTRVELLATFLRAAPPHEPVVDRAMTVASVVLCGMGGAGKSQLAAEFWHRWRELVTVPGLMLWANATSRSSIIESFADAAVAVHGVGDPPMPADPESRATRLLTWCESTDRPWLIVLDDVSDPADMLRLWPPYHPRGVTLTTTRRTDAAFHASGRQTVVLGPFTPDESRAYLNRKLQDPALLDGADDLAESLQHLPLALAQATSFIVDRGETCAGYRARFEDERRSLGSLFPNDALADDYERTVASTISIALDAANALAPSGVARRILEIAALLDSNGFPLAWLASDPIAAHVGREQPELPDGSASSLGQACRDGVFNLARFSLVHVDHTSGRVPVVRTHALVQRAAREWNNSRQDTASAAADALLENWQEDPRRPELGQVLRDNALAVLASSRGHLWRSTAHQLIFRLGASLQDARLIRSSLRYWATISEQAERELGHDHPDALAARANLALTYSEDRQYPQALELFAQVVEESRSLRGAEHTETLAAEANYASTLASAGAPENAIATLVQLEQVGARVWGPSDPRNLVLRHNLADIRGEAGDCATAVGELTRVVEGWAQVLGPEHPRTLSSRLRLAHWTRQAGDEGAAIEILQQTAAALDRALGPHHIETLTALGSLGRWRGEAGDFDGAVNIMRCLVEAREASQGRNHPDSLRAHRDLVRWQESAGEAPDAVREFAALEEQFTRALGPNHRDTLITGHYLARCRGKTGEPAQAFEQLADLVPRMISSLGPDDPDTLYARASLAGWRGEAGDPLGAATGMRELLPDVVRVLGSRDQNTRMVRRAIGHWSAQAERSTSPATDFWRP